MRCIRCSFIILFVLLIAAVFYFVRARTGVGLVIMIVIIVAMIPLPVVWFCLRRKKSKKMRKGEAQPDDITDMRKGEAQPDDITDIVSGMPRMFSAKDLESATDNFRKRLGGGGFGAVFEGILDEGTRVAVKRLDLNLGQGRKEFLAEVKTIGITHHFNLVKLVGFCAENAHKLLVYEYMSNGSLDSWIFHGNVTLRWQTRSKIILHVARGLSYLHEECSRRIIHLDIKPQNILLDEEFNGKLSDFGLARFIDRDQSQVQTTVRGTRGYMAPEWFSNRGISIKADVYSFGIVVLEILFGRKNLDHLQTEEDETLLHLVRRKAEEDQLYDVVDSQNGDMLQNKEAVVKMMRVAIMCARHDSRRRPSMSTVVKVLEDVMEIEDIVDPMEVYVDVSEVGSAPQLPEILSGPR